MDQVTMVRDAVGSLDIYDQVYLDGAIIPHAMLR